jgi:type I restriction enzyme S subunit
MKSALFSTQVDKVKGQAAIMDFVSLSDQRRMVLDLPLPPVQARFAELVGPVLSRMSSNRASAAVLANLRDTLVPRLISGRLRLPEAQEQLEGALA